MKHALVVACALLVMTGCVRHLHEVRASEATTNDVVFELPPHRVERAPRPARSERVALRPPPARYRIDWSFIQELEGRARQNGYVPTAGSERVLGRSGVTIATGFDLGQHDAADLWRMGIDDELVAVLRPYLRRRGQSARSALERRPLRLTAHEVAALDRAKRLDTARKLERRFDAARAPHVPPFAGLSPARQTVLFSLATQYGPRLDRKTPAFWGHMVNGRVRGAVAELRHFGDRYETRRNREADLLSGEPERIDSPRG